LTAGFTADQMLAGRRLFSSPAEFIMGVVALDLLPKAEGVEIAFAGRSNAGKSSLINALTGVNGLARASNTPGRTRELNFFRIGELTFVDLPGYGFAKAAKKDVRAWQALLRGYLRGRRGLTRVFVMVDGRHGLMAADDEMLELLAESGVPYQIVLTKSDKLKPGEAAAVLEETGRKIAKRAAALPGIYLTSSQRHSGFEDLRAEIAALL
jgi:GTP-binding protein